MTAQVEATPAPPRAAYLAQGLIIAVALVFSFYGLHKVYLNDNGYSRLATVHALLNNGNWYLDPAPGEVPNLFSSLTVDKVLVNGRMISSKPPVMPLFMAVVCWVMQHVGGPSLNNEGDLKRVVQVLTIVFCILPFALGLYFFTRMTRQYMRSPWIGAAALFALAFGTQLFGFTPQLLNHVPGAAFCIGAIYFGVGLFTGTLAPTPARFVAFGVFGGLTHTFELPLTIYMAALGIALLVRFPRQAILWGGLGMLPFIVVQSVLLYITTGMPLPVQTRHELYLYENSPWRCPVGIDGLNEPKIYYAFHLLIGRHGVFLLYPVLIFGWLAFVAAVRRHNFPYRAFVIVAGLCTAVVFAYYIRDTDNYGGAAYGFRWAIGVMPVLLLMALPYLDHMRRRTLWVIFALTLAVSVYSGFECYFNPWSMDAEWTSRLIFGPSI